MKAARRFALLVSVGGFLIATPGIHAQTSSSPEQKEPINPDRPDFTEGNEPLPHGYVQLEGGYTFARQGDDKQQTLGEWLLRIPTTTNSELRIYLNSYEWDRGPGGKASGFQDIAVGTKIKFAKAKGPRPAVSVVAFTTLPTGNDQIGEDQWQPTVKLVLGWNLSEKEDLTANINYTDASDGGKRFSQWAGSLSYGRELSENWGAFLEYYGFFPGSKDGPNSHTLDSGLSFQANRNLILDARVGVGLNGHSNDYFVGTGATHRW